MKRRRRVPAFAWFFLWIAFFSLAFTRAFWIADSLLLAALIVTMIVFSGAKVYKLWKYRNDPQMLDAHASSGQGSIFDNDRWRRWALDDHGDHNPRH